MAQSDVERFLSPNHLLVECDLDFMQTGDIIKLEPDDSSEYEEMDESDIALIDNVFRTEHNTLYTSASVCFQTQDVNSIDILSAPNSGTDAVADFDFTHERKSKDKDVRQLLSEMGSAKSVETKETTELTKYNSDVKGVFNYNTRKHKANVLQESKLDVAAITCVVKQEYEETPFEVTENECVVKQEPVEQYNYFSSGSWCGYANCMTKGLPNPYVKLQRCTNKCIRIAEEVKSSKGRVIRKPKWSNFYISHEKHKQLDWPNKRKIIKRKKGQIRFLERKTHGQKRRPTTKTVKYSRVKDQRALMSIPLPVPTHNPRPTMIVRNNILVKDFSTVANRSYQYNIKQEPIDLEIDVEERTLNGDSCDTDLKVRHEGRNDGEDQDSDVDVEAEWDSAYFFTSIQELLEEEHNYSTLETSEMMNIQRNKNTKARKKHITKNSSNTTSKGKTCRNDKISEVKGLNKNRISKTHLTCDPACDDGEYNRHKADLHTMLERQRRGDLAMQFRYLFEQTTMIPFESFHATPKRIILKDATSAILVLRKKEEALKNVKRTLEARISVNMNIIRRFKKY